MSWHTILAAAMGKIALLCTSAKKLGDLRTGAWSEEITAPYYVFQEAGYDVTIISVKGGKIPIDKKSLASPTQSDERFRADPIATQALEHSKSLREIDLSQYDAVFIAGGHGAVVDLVDESVGQAITNVWAAGKVVGAVCHGVAGLLKACDHTGTPLPSARNLTAFSDTEEQEVGLANAVPFLLETALREQGASYTCKDPWSSHCVTDGNLVTGQNPQSSTACAEAILIVLAQHQFSSSTPRFQDKRSHFVPRPPSKNLKRVGSIEYSSEVQLVTPEHIMAAAGDLLSFFGGLQHQIYQKHSFKQLPNGGSVDFSELITASSRPYCCAAFSLPCSGEAVAQYAIFGINQEEWDPMCTSVEVIREEMVNGVPKSRHTQLRVERRHYILGTMMKPREAMIMSFLLWLDDGTFLQLSRSIGDSPPSSPTYQTLLQLWHSVHISPSKNGCLVEIISLWDIGGVGAGLLGWNRLKSSLYESAVVWQRMLTSVVSHQISLDPAMQTPAAHIPSSEVGLCKLPSAAQGLYKWKEEASQLQVNYSESQNGQILEVAELFALEDTASVLQCRFHNDPVVSHGINFGGQFQITNVSDKTLTVYVAGAGTYDVAGITGDERASEVIEKGCSATLTKALLAELFAALHGASEKTLASIHAAFAPLIAAFHGRKTMFDWGLHQVVSVVVHGRAALPYPVFVAQCVKRGDIEIARPDREHARVFLEAYSHGRPILPPQYYKKYGATLKK